MKRQITDLISENLTDSYLESTIYLNWIITSFFCGKFKIRDEYFIFFPSISRYKNENFTPTFPPLNFDALGRLYSKAGPEFNTKTSSSKYFSHVVWLILGFKFVQSFRSQM